MPGKSSTKSYDLEKSNAKHPMNGIRKPRTGIAERRALLMISIGYYYIWP
ncbi:hypothetical protein ACT7DF_22350 [Bacillus cereus]